MPQPFKNRFPDWQRKQCRYGIMEGLENRPEIAKLVASCISAASMGEVNLYRLYIYLSGAKADAAFATLDAVGGRRNRLSILKSVGIAVLPESEHELFGRVIRLCVSRFKMRDKLAHRLWGLSDDLPDDALLINPVGWLQLDANAVRQSGRPSHLPQDSTLMDHIEVYTTKDFEFIKTQLDRAATAVDHLIMLYMESNAQKKESYRQEIERLIN